MADTKHGDNLQRMGKITVGVIYIDEHCVLLTKSRGISETLFWRDRQTSKHFKKFTNDLFSKRIRAPSVASHVYVDTLIQQDG